MLKVRCFSRHDEINATSKMTTENRLTFNSLRQRTEYGFQVRAKTTHGWGDFSPTIFKTTGQVLGTGKDEIKINFSFFQEVAIENSKLSKTSKTDF